MKKFFALVLIGTVFTMISCSNFTDYPINEDKEANNKLSSVQSNIDNEPTVLTFEFPSGTTSLQFSRIFQSPDNEDIIIDLGNGNSYRGAYQNAPTISYPSGTYEIKLWAKSISLNLSNSKITKCNLSKDTKYSEVSFYNSSLEEITCTEPPKLYQNNYSASFDFNNCTQLIAIPENLFYNATEMVFISTAFANCSSLISIPEGLFRNNTKLETLYGTFNGCFRLTSIPEGLFQNNPQLTSLEFTFSSCNSLRTLPVGLFRNNPNMRDFYETFRNCRNLREIPQDLFVNNRNATTFIRCFENCPDLSYAIPIWDSYPQAEGAGCYRDCINASNYNQIPLDWK